jgi:hypothetical protein
VKKITDLVSQLLGRASLSLPLLALSLSKRDKDEQPLLLDSLVASFHFIFWEAGIWQTNAHGGTCK